jgi:hypothetical protein
LYDKTSVMPILGPVMRAHSVLRFEISAFSYRHVSEGDPEFPAVSAKAFEFASWERGYKEVTHCMTHHVQPGNGDVVKESVFYFEAI